MLNVTIRIFLYTYLKGRKQETIGFIPSKLQQSTLTSKEGRSKNFF